MIEVFLEGLEFYGFHGVPAAEREVGHRYSVDIHLNVNSQAEHTDNVEDTVDYAKIGVELLDIAENSQYKTLERIAQVMAEQTLKTHSRIDGVQITIRKLLPPAPFVAEASGVTLELRR